MKKRLFSILLCIVILCSLLPTTVWASVSDGDYYVKFGRDLYLYNAHEMPTATGDVAWYVNGTDGALGTVYTDAAPGNWNAKLSYDGDSKFTLTLNGLNLNIEATTGISVYGVPLTLVLNGTNTVTATNTAGSEGIYVLKSLTISGDGTLNVSANGIGTSNYGLFVTGGITMESGTVIAAAGDNTEGASYGVSVTFGLNMKGGTLTATGGDAKGDSIGIRVDTGCFIMENAIVNATGGESTDSSSYGIYAAYGFEMSNGTVNATGGAAKYSSYGIFVKVDFDEDTAMIVTGGEIIAKGGDVHDPGYSSKVVGSYGIQVDNTGSGDELSVTGGTVTAIGGNSNPGNSCGVGGKVDVSGGEITAKGGTIRAAGAYSSGFASNVNIYGGTVIASGEDNAFYARPYFEQIDNFTIIAGESEADAAAWDNSTGLSTYKYVKIEPAPLRTAVSIEVSGDFKKEYEVLRDADWSNMVVTVHYDNGSSKVLGSSEYTITGFDNSGITTGDDSVTRTVTVSYEGLSDTFDITVSKRTLTLVNVAWCCYNRVYQSGYIHYMYPTGTYRNELWLGENDFTTYYVSVVDGVEVGERTTVKPSDAGTYYGYYTFAGNEYWKAVSEQTKIDAVLIIEKATPTVTAPTAKTLTFTGSEQELVNAGSTTGGTLQYSLNNAEWSADIPTGTNTGSYTVYYRVVGGNNYNDVAAQSVDVAIGMADGSVTAPTAKTLTYTGEAQALINAGSSSTGEIQYKLGADGAWGAEIPEATEAGTYTVYYKVTGDANHSDVAEASVSVTIAQAEAAEPTVSGTYTYTGAAQTAALTGVESYMTVTGDTQTNAGTYTITVELDANHKWAAGSDGSISWTIEEAEITAPAEDSTEFTYNGEAQTYTIATGEDYTIGGDGVTQTNAGTYTITVTLKDTVNTKWSDGTTAAKEYTFVINKAVVTVAAKDRSVYVGQSAPDLSAPVEDTHYTVAGLIGEDTVDLTGITMAYGETPDTSRTGTFEITVSGANGGTNYDVVYTAGTLTISYAPVYVHSCTGKCPVCGKCMDKACAETACADKCSGDENAFTDVAEDAWYTEAVKYVFHLGLMDGIGDGRFAPEMTTSRGMIVTILWRLETEPEMSVENAFTDVESGAWYAEAVAWAEANGIVNGYDNGGFGPNDDITREQLAAILWRYAKYKGCDVSVGEDTNILSYEDAFDISEYAIPAMQWACGEGIVTGKGEGILDPKGSAKRCEAALMLMRFLENK